jgi:hypothetical protein
MRCPTPRRTWAEDPRDEGLRGNLGASGYVVADTEAVTSTLKKK